MKKLVAVVCGAALMGASGLAAAQTTPYSNKPATSTAGKSMDFKRMDANSDGRVSREENLAFLGSRFDTSNPVTPLPGTKGGVGNPPATGGGSK